MGKSKRTSNLTVQKVAQVLVPPEPNKIYVYKRDWKLTQPVPWEIEKNYESIDCLRILWDS